MLQGGCREPRKPNAWVSKARGRNRNGPQVTLSDGLYSVEFETLLGAGSGVLVVSGSKLRGGDGTFAYFGTQSPTGNGFTAEIETKRHSEGRASVFNMEPAHIRLVGRLDGVNAVCTGTAAEAPGLIFKVVLKFIAA
jgi:hypothetical protein